MDNQENVAAPRIPPPAGKGKRHATRWRTAIVYGIGVAVLAALVAAFWPKPISVETALVTRGDLITRAIEEGKTRIRNRYTVAAPVGGYLNRVSLSSGDRVESGRTILATIQAPPAGLLDPRAKAEAEARVDMVEAAKHQRESDLERARAELQRARREFDRTDVLERQGGVARREWEDAETRVRVLEKEAASAEYALRAAEFEVQQARAVLAQATTPETARSELLRITAPIDGVVLHVFEESARTIAAGTPIMEIGNPHDLEVEVDLLSRDAVAIAPGAEVSIEQWGGETPLRGRVRLIEPGGFTKVSALGVEEQRVRARIAILDSVPPPMALGDRFRVEASIVTWHGENILQVPVGALFRRGNQWMAFVVKEAKARLTRIDIGHENGVFAEVLSGLAEGDRVIVYPPDSVDDGTRISPRPAKSP